MSDFTEIPLKLQNELIEWIESIGLKNSTVAWRKDSIETLKSKAKLSY